MTAAMTRVRSASVLGEYLWARRSLVQPEAVGITREPNRRVPGLRREEVAQRAAISPEYYLRLEQGHDREPSNQVLRGLAKALLLDADAERHMARLRRLQPVLRHASPASVEGGPLAPPERLVRLLERWADLPAFTTSGNFDVLAVNRRVATLGDRRIRPGINLVESVFSTEGRHEQGWATRAARSSGALRYHGDPYDLRFQQLVGRLSIRDEDFRRLWARYDARPVPNGRIRIDVDGAAASHSTFHAFEAGGSDGLLMFVLSESTG